MCNKKCISGYISGKLSKTSLFCFVLLVIFLEKKNQQNPVYVMVKVHFKNCLDRYIHILSGNFIFIFCQPFPNGAIFYICIYILHLPFWTKGTWLFIFRPLFSHDFKITHLPSWFYTLKQKLEWKTSSLLISLHVERTPGRRWKLCLSKGRRTTETRTWMSTGDEARKLKRKSEMKITEAKQRFRRKHQDW